MSLPTMTVKHVYELMAKQGKTLIQGPWGEWIARCSKCGYQWQELNPDFKPSKCVKCGAEMKA